MNVSDTTRLICPFPVGCQSDFVASLLSNIPLWSSGIAYLNPSFGRSRAASTRNGVVSEILITTFRYQGIDPSIPNHQNHMIRTMDQCIPSHGRRPPIQTRAIRKISITKTLHERCEGEKCSSHVNLHQQVQEDLET